MSMHPSLMSFHLLKYWTNMFVAYLYGPFAPSYNLVTALGPL